MDDPTATAWHLDRRIPVSLIAAILMQTLGGVWWARGLSASLEQTMLDQTRLEARVDRIETERDDLRARMIRVEEKLSVQTTALIDQSATLKEILKHITTIKH